MIETALVYLYATTPTSRFVGCGAVIEGGLIATCRHVWQDAVGEAAEDAVVEVEFPRAHDGGRVVREPADLADACEGEPPVPDLVLLRPKAIPSGTLALQLATAERLETGAATSRARIMRKQDWTEASISGQLDPALNPDGRRQFTGENRQGYWFVRGSSGSPVFLQGGQQLAGILSLAELGANEGKSPLQEAFAVPATTIRRFRERLAAQPVAQAQHIDPAKLRPVLDAIDAADVPVVDIPERLLAFVEAARAQAAEPVKASNGGGDITAVIGAARVKLGQLDVAGARNILAAKVAEEHTVRGQRLLPLLWEQATIAWLSFDQDGLRKALKEVTHLAPDDTRAWIALGDAWRNSGSLLSAVEAYRAAKATAECSGNEHDLSASHERIGSVLRVQGDCAGALTAYRSGATILERLVAVNPSNSEWQRGLSGSYEQIGDVLLMQGDRASALTAYHVGKNIRERLLAVEPDNAQWQHEYAISCSRVGDPLTAAGDHAGALVAYRAGKLIFQKLADTYPSNVRWQRELSISHQRIGYALQVQGDHGGALTAYHAGLAIQERLTTTDPGNLRWRLDFSISHKSIGDVLAAGGDHVGALTSYRAGVAIAERLVIADPSNAQWQRDLSIGYRKIGGVLAAQGDHAGALVSYRTSVTIAERLTIIDPGNANWQHDLSIVQEQIGDTMLAQGDHVGSLANHRASMANRERLVAIDPANAEWLRNLAASCIKLSEVEPQRTHHWFSRALQIFRTLAASGRLTERETGQLRDFEEMLQGTSA